MLKKFLLINMLLVTVVLYGNEKNLKIEMVNRINEYVILKVVSDEVVVPKEYTKNNIKYHIIKEGDTLYKLSKEYNIPLSKLKELNKITNENLIIVGKKLIVEEDYE